VRNELINRMGEIDNKGRKREQESEGSERKREDKEVCTKEFVCVKEMKQGRKV
jgi:hypothetical protein